MHRPPPPPRPPAPSGPKPPSSSSKPKSSSSSQSQPVPSPAAYFSESQLPSCKSGFLKPHEERTTRRKTCRFIEEAARCLKLPRVTTSTSLVFFHRFYAVHSFEDHDRFEVAVACLLLAAKTEESPKKLIAVVQECYRLKNMSAKKTGVQKPGVKIDKRGYLDMKCEEFIRLKERVLLLERVILHTIGFELSIAHPYKLLVEQIKKLVPSRQLEYINPAKNKTPPKQDEMMKELVQNSLNFVNDSMQTSLCLQFPPKTIAHACVYMSGQFCKMRPTEGRKWLDILDVEMWELANIVLQIMELIADKKGIDKSAFEPIKADLDKMKIALGGIPNGGNRNHSPRPPPAGKERDPKRQRV